MLTRPPARSTRVTRPLVAAPLVIAMPEGLTLGGVSTWAMRLAASLSSGLGGVPPRHVTLLLHGDAANRDQMELPRSLPNVAVRRLMGLPRLRDAGGDLGPYIAAYRPVIEEIYRESGRPCLLCPTALGDAYGVAAALCLTHPEMVRVIGWQHSDIAYDARVLAHYEPILAGIAGVSTHIVGELASALPHRRSDISWVPYGVEVPGVYPPARSAMLGEVGTSARPLRLIYTGRIEHEQKRVGALLALSRHLGRLGIRHELVLVGDGPASAEVDAAIRVVGADQPHDPESTSPGRKRAGASLPEQTAPLAHARGSLVDHAVALKAGGTPVPLARVRRVAAIAPNCVAGLLDAADVFVLASRYEGLSVSMLEAMARGCIPIVTHVASGADDAITHGVNGVHVPVLPAASDDDVGRSLALAVQKTIMDQWTGRPARADCQRLCPGGTPGPLASLMSYAAWRTVKERYSLERHALLVSDFLDRAESSPARAWPASRACAFTAMSGGVEVGGSGTVPPDGAARLQRMLASLTGKAIVLHGAGRHTLELAGVLAQSAANIVAITDDDPAKWGGTLLGWRVVSPAEVSGLGATDVVISSWIHGDAVYDRRGVYEQRGLAVHRLYGGGE